jgi:hypothetical protein
MAARWLRPLSLRSKLLFGTLLMLAPILGLLLTEFNASYDRRREVEEAMGGQVRVGWTM